MPTNNEPIKRTMQDCIDIMFAHAATMPRKATYPSGRCAYLTPSGDMCVIGSLISADTWTAPPSMLGAIALPRCSDWNAIEPQIIPTDLAVGRTDWLEVLGRLQSAHDGTLGHALHFNCEVIRRMKDELNRKGLSSLIPEKYQGGIYA